MSTDDILVLLEQTQALVDSTGKPHGLFRRKTGIAIKALSYWSHQDPTLLECISPVTHSPRSNKLQSNKG